MATTKVNLTKLMYTINVNMVRGRSYEKINIYHTKVS